MKAKERLKITIKKVEISPEEERRRIERMACACVKAVVRKAVRREKEKVAGSVVDDFRIFINELPFKKRLSLAWRILWKTY
jgi:hypothetical protein